MWELIRLSDKKWGVRLDGKELYILSRRIHWMAAGEVERMLNTVVREAEFQRFRAQE